MIKRVVVALVVTLCAVSLSLHFAVESLGGSQDHFIGGQSKGMFDSHEGDQFLLSEPGNDNPAQTWIWITFTARLKMTSRPLAPLFQPPKST
jgi:hypothetical protein